MSDRGNPLPSLMNFPFLLRIYEDSKSKNMTQKYFKMSMKKRQRALPSKLNNLKILNHPVTSSSASFVVVWVTAPDPASPFSASLGSFSSPKFNSSFLLFFSTFLIASDVNSCLNIFSITSFFLVLLSPTLIRTPAVILHVILQQRITVVKAKGRTW